MPDTQRIFYIRNGWDNAWHITTNDPLTKAQCGTLLPGITQSATIDFPETPVCKRCLRSYGKLEAGE